jgi:hypothetical protein
MKQPQDSITINIGIVPFGCAIVRMGGSETREEKIEPQPSFYTEPKTTNPQIIEIRFGGQDYAVPRTTGGLF